MIIEAEPPPHTSKVGCPPWGEPAGNMYSTPLYVTSLSISVIHQLQAVGILTIGDLVGKSPQPTLSEVGNRAVQRLLRRAEKVRSSPKEALACVWGEYNSPLVLLSILEVLLDGLSARSISILWRRIGLLPHADNTLQKLAIGLGITRERTRQLEVRGFALLKSRWETRHHLELPPTWMRELDELKDLSATWPLLLGDDTVWRILADHYKQVIPVEDHPSWRMLWALWGWHTVGKETLRRAGLVETAWLRDARGKAVLSILPSLLQRLIPPPSSMNTVLVESAIAQECGITLIEAGIVLEEWVALGSQWEIAPDSRIQQRFTRLSRSDRVVRLLEAAGRPLPLETLQEQILALDPRSRPANSRWLANNCYADDRLIAVGRSGAWALSTWESETRGINVLIEEYLQKRGSPAQTREIEAWVRTRRWARPNTIRSMISQHPKLIRGDRGYELIEWGLPHPFQDPEKRHQQWLAVIRDHLADGKVWPWADARPELTRLSGMHPKVISHTIRATPDLTLIRVGSYSWEIRSKGTSVCCPTTQDNSTSDDAYEGAT